MAIFERSCETIIRVDDTDKLECILENAQNINKHTEYIIRVQRGLNKDNRRLVSRRYKDFAALNLDLQQANIDLPIPPKKLIGNMQPSFIAERQIALQNYINEILRHQMLALSFPVRSFLDPHNYSLSIAEQALQTVSIALRGDGQYELKAPLSDIGWRIRKHYFIVNESKAGKNCLLSYQSYGPDHTLHVKDLQTAFKSLQNISHPYIAETLTMHTLETGAYVVRRIYENGSIRDLLYGTEYNKNYLAKYGNPKVRKPLTNGQISHYGYQILQALKFLHDKGLPHGHIHTGNITIDNQTALLLDIENFLMGVPCVYRPYILESKRANSMEAVDVYCFGRTIYEMAFAIPLEQYYCDVYQDGISHDLESVLRLCISSSSCKQEIPTLDTLLHHPFFTLATLNGLAPRFDRRPHLKFPLNIKEPIKTAVTVVEDRIKSDQKLLRSTKREVRIQEILNSEEEMKKQKKRAKKRSGEWKSSSSLAEASRSASAASDHSPNNMSTNSSYHTDSSPNTGNTNNVTSTGNTNNVTSTGNTNNVVSTGKTTNGGTTDSSTGGTTSDARGALLSDICSFNRNRLSRVTQR